MSETDFLSISEAHAEVAGVVTRWQVWKLCRAGVIPTVRLGLRPDSGPYGIPREEWKRFLRERIRRSGLRVVARDGELTIDRVLRERA